MFYTFLGHYCCGLACCISYENSHPAYCCWTACCPVGLLFPISSCCFFFFQTVNFCLSYCWKHSWKYPCAFSRFLLFGWSYKFLFLEAFSKYIFELWKTRLPSIESSVRLDIRYITGTFLSTITVIIFWDFLIL